MKYFQTISNKNLIKQIFDNKNSYVMNIVVLYFMPNDLNMNRFLFITSKKIGNAVVRNKVRRRLKSIISDFCKDEKLVGMDCIIITRKPIVNFNFEKLKDLIYKIIRKKAIK